MFEAPIQTITYFSSAKVHFSDESLLNLLKKSRENNLRFGITGMLLYKSGCFIQSFEGSKEAVYQLYKNICADVTHHNIIKVIDESMSERAFSDWNMGFMDISTAETSVISGYSDFFQKDKKAEDFQNSQSRAKKLLFHFRDTMKSSM